MLAISDCMCLQASATTESSRLRNVCMTVVLCEIRTVPYRDCSHKLYLCRCGAAGMNVHNYSEAAGMSVHNYSEAAGMSVHNYSEAAGMSVHNYSGAAGHKLSTYTLHVL